MKVPRPCTIRHDIDCCRVHSLIIKCAGFRPCANGRPFAFGCRFLTVVLAPSFFLFPDFASPASHMHDCLGSDAPSGPPGSIAYRLDTDVYDGPQSSSQAMVGCTALTSTIKNLPPRDFLAALLSSPGDAGSSSCTACTQFDRTDDLSKLCNSDREHSPQSCPSCPNMINRG